MVPGGCWRWSSEDTVSIPATQWRSSEQRAAYAIGFGCRFGLHYHPDSEGIYIAEYLFVVLSVCPFVLFLRVFWLTKTCTALCIYRSQLCLVRTTCETYVMRYARSSACTEIDTRFRVLGYHNIPDSSHRWRNVRLSQSNSATDRHACVLIVTTSGYISDCIF